jgi:hypothetical protein
MEPSTFLPMIENNVTPLIVWVLVYFTMVRGIRRDLQEIKEKINNNG